jgi:PAS domain-containing protein
MFGLVRFPRIPPKAEIILKERFLVDGEGKHDVAFPELIVLANKAGYRYLGKVFHAMSELHTRSDLNHEHFARLTPPFSRRLSDDIEIRLCLINRQVRRRILYYYDIRRGTQRKEGLVGRYRDLIRRARIEETRCRLARRSGVRVGMSRA